MGSSMGTPGVNNRTGNPPRIPVLKVSGAKGRASPAARAACPPQGSANTAGGGGCTPEGPGSLPHCRQQQGPSRQGSGHLSAAQGGHGTSWDKGAKP